MAYRSAMANPCKIDAKVIAQPETRRSIRRYLQLHNIGPDAEGQPFYHPATSVIDGVTMMAFSSMRESEMFLLSEDYRAIEAAETAIAKAGAAITGQAPRSQWSTNSGRTRRPLAERHHGSSQSSIRTP